MLDNLALAMLLKNKNHYDKPTFDHEFVTRIEITLAEMKTLLDQLQICQDYKDNISDLKNKK